MASQEPQNLSGARDLQRVEALRRRLADDPRSLVFVSLAEELNRVGEHAEAASVAQRGLLTHPDSVAGRLALAVAEAELDHVKEALEQIKRALIIDQENPQALALMGQILLKRGLAKRAVQFLSHAVKLAPQDQAYGQLLNEARRQVQAAPEQPPPPVLSADSIPVENDPWADDAQPGVEHTVFDPDAGAIPPRKAVGTHEEPTAFQHPLPRKNKDNPAKMGGSAAEYSQMMRRLQLPENEVSEAEPTVTSAKAPRLSSANGAAAGQRPPPAPSGTGMRAVPSAQRPPPVAPSTIGKPPSKAAAPVPTDPPAAASRVVAASKVSSPPSKGGEAGKKKDPSVKAPKPAKASKPAQASTPVETPKVGPAPNKKVGPAATRMVDDALWVLLGKRGGADAPSESAAEDVAEAPGEPVRARPRLRAPNEEAAGPRVVRTSERFGTWATVATLVVLSVTGALIGHWVMLSSAGPGPEVTSEEVKGLATDLERGGLAFLLSAEERTNELARSAPQLKPLLNGVRAELYARRWRNFGRDPEMRSKAQQAVGNLAGRRPTVEHLAGLVALSTSAAQREPLIDALRQEALRYPESPKIRVLQAQLHAAGGRERAALNALFEARALHKQHRGTMLELARWYERSDANRAALSTYARLLDRHPLDIEAAIERYVLGQCTGADPDETQAVNLLAGLIRDENPEVAKDETGRASLAFAVPLLARGQLVEGIEALGQAEAAFERSSAFKRAVADAYLAVGEFDRAEMLYEAAVKLAPRKRAPSVGLARAQFAKATGMRVDLTREAEKIAERFEKQREKGAGTARLPFGTLKLVPGRFELLVFKPEASVFPEEAYRRARNPADLASANHEALGLRHLAAGENDQAVEQFRAAVKASPNVSAQFGLGRALLVSGQADEAQRVLRQSLADDPSHVLSRLWLGRALLEKDQPIEALTVLEPLERASVVVPDGLLLLGQLRLARTDFERAAKPLKTVAELQPQNADAQLAYGEVLHRLRRSDEALAAFSAAVRADADISQRKTLSPIAIMYLGRVELERSNRRGVALLRRALKSEDVPVEAHFYLGRALVRARRTRREGLRQLDRYVRIAPTGELRGQAERLLRR